MVNYLSKLLAFFATNHTTNLDLYLQSKNVQTPADIEYWIQQWDRMNKVAYF